jgi:hypothetical protein
MEISESCTERILENFVIFDLKKSPIKPGIHGPEATQNGALQTSSVIGTAHGQSNVE